MNDVAVLGAGSWGATLAAHLAKKGEPVSLWEFYPEAAAALQKTRRLAVLPALTLPRKLRVTSDIAEALSGAKTVIWAVPSHFMRQTAQAARLHLNPRAEHVGVAKGIENKSLLRMSQVLSDVLASQEEPLRLAALSGPSHAEEVCRNIPTSIVVASRKIGLARRMQKLFMTSAFRVYTTNDVIGVELGGALKNIIAIGCGACDGLGLGDNTKAALMTRGLAEITRLGVKCGAKRETFFGLSGMGDLIVTCLSRHSRNRLLGEKVGRGKSLSRALSEMVMVAEGVRTTESAHHLARKMKVEMPIVREIYLALFKGKRAEKALKDLMHRKAKPEGG